MCGICFIFGGVSIHDHQFDFNFFSAYLSKHNVPLNNHIIEHKLVLPPTFEPKKISQKIKQRGPDYLGVNHVDLFKVNYKNIEIHSLQENHVANKGEAYGFQSILHLRGENLFTPDTPGCYFLFNGQIWDTGNLTSIQVHENDSQWLYRTLMQCKGSKQKISQVLQNIRGDYAFVFVEGDQVFVGKDYFGKRSLLLGMGQNYFIFTSVPIHDSVRIIQNENVEENQAEQNQQSWKQKYEAQWTSSKNKFYFEVPANTLINLSMDTKSGKVRWQGENIHKINLSTIPKQPQITEEIVKGNIKKLLIQNLKEITKCIHNLGQKEHPQTKIAVLFSGGIDSTLIARLLDFVLPKNQSIDLINLSFREDAPDRQSGKIAYEQLKTLSPDRNYNLILLDKKLQDVEMIKKDLMEVIYPKSTHMDFNIAGSLNIAVTGTKSKIVLTGLGADQIFSGYSRYRIAHKRAGFVQLQKQMIFDMERLWVRNLGRDDRAIASRAKQVRYPFLYLPLWLFLRSVPIEMLTQGSGEKIMLRKIAKEFGLEKSATFKKRAIQFGTRLAKLSNVKCFGSNRKAKGNYEYK